MASDTIALLEAAYRLGGSEAEWVAGLADEAYSQLDHGLGVVAYTMDMTAAGPVLGPMVGRPADPEIVGFARDRLAVMPPLAAEIVCNAPVGFAASSEIAPPEMVSAFFSGSPRGIADVVGVQALDPSGISAWITAPSTSMVRVQPAQRERWQRVAVHVAAALRLRRGLGATSALDAADAVLETDLSVAHAAASSEASLATLRAFAKDLDRARGTLRREAPDEALGLWRGLCDGTWSLVDHFDTDGRRYFVAIQNAPAGRAERSLTPRERQVVSLVALGRSDKLIAYELGLAEVTVSGFLSSAMRKIGVSDRLSLIRLVLSLRG